MRSGATMLIVLAVLIVISSGTDYCNIRYCGSRHTVCKYPKPFLFLGPSVRCTGHQGSGLSNDEKKRIVDLHNKLRQKVAKGQETRGIGGGQPPTKYMPDLIWDDELSFIAQRWADQCIWAHDECRRVSSSCVGQNIAYQASSGNLNTGMVDSMVQMWYDEVKDFDRREIAKFTDVVTGGKVIGHYTQLVWANTTRIGCGAVKYREGVFNRFYLVCNYGSSGNVIGQAVYETA